MIDNNIENKLRKFNEDLRLDLTIKYRLFARTYFSGRGGMAGI